jgi:hypothetical protein
MSDLEKPAESLQDINPILTDIVPILTLPPDEPEPYYTPEQLEYKYKKEKAQRCKVISMDALDLPLWKNMTYATKNERFFLLKEMERWFEKPDDEIKTAFNKVCTDKMLNFEDPKNDWTNYGISKQTIPS